MDNQTILTFDIETLPIEDPFLDVLIEYKVKNFPEGEREKKKQYYKFLNPAYARVAAIGTLYQKPDGDTISKVFIGDEFAILNEFSKYLKKFRGIYVHFNGMGFDVPFILARMAVHGIEPPNERFCNLIKYKTNPHYDVMSVLCSWREWGTFSVSLREAAHMFNVEDPKNILSDKDTATFLLTATEDQIKAYVMGDVMATYEIYKKLSKILN